MTPREKAKELFEKFRIHSPVWEVKDDAKKCALIAVNEILGLIFLSQAEINYWQEVKHEIQNL
jgi:hypothetical protein